MSLIVEINDLHFSHLNNSNPTLNGVDLELMPGQVLVVLGENGAGKTTLLDLIMGFRRAGTGSIKVLGNDLKVAGDPWQARQNIVYLSEKIDIPADWTVQAYLEFNRFFYPKYHMELERQLLDEFNLEYAFRIGSLSTGQVRRIQVVGALASRPQLMLIDEVTALLDIVGRKKLVQLMKQFKSFHQTSFIVATNILEDISEYADELILLKAGKVRWRCGVRSAELSAQALSQEVVVRLED
jgi:ABC-2 type transport system ATP-binding protein